MYVVACCIVHQVPNCACAVCNFTDDIVNEVLADFTEHLHAVVYFALLISLPWETFSCPGIPQVSHPPLWNQAWLSNVVRNLIGQYIQAILRELVYLCPINFWKMAEQKWMWPDRVSSHNYFDCNFKLCNNIVWVVCWPGHTCSMHVYVIFRTHPANFKSFNVHTRMIQ